MSNVQTPFRYDYVGSFLRPEKLKKARADFQAGNIGEKELKEVGTQSVHETEEEMYKIEYEGGSISVTGNHPVWSVTRNAYIRADDIQEDEEIMVDA